MDDIGRSYTTRRSQPMIKSRLVQADIKIDHHGFVTPLGKASCSGAGGGSITLPPDVTTTVADSALHLGICFLVHGLCVLWMLMLIKNQK